MLVNRVRTRLRNENSALFGFQALMSLFPGSKSNGQCEHNQRGYITFQSLWIANSKRGTTSLVGGRWSNTDIDEKLVNHDTGTKRASSSRGVYGRSFGTTIAIAAAAKPACHQIRWPPLRVCRRD